eukprot:TRINITY_DN609_c0_g1_i1.p1 TRINITY_DN609_c0_g1~~TRINITY_DN609_c0_g1_i1.p1  ORF type:complete len:284 (+),score=81.86 TRINITY_DN609_c0_g1_i1:58-909(+)
MSRPEHVAPPEIFYNDREAKKYAANSRIIEIQSRMSERAIELLNLPDDQPAFVLDLGCGSGLSGEVLTEKGHYWLGMDISPDMLNVAMDREVEGDLMQLDMGQGMPFRPGVFDGVISISALQWLFYSDKKVNIPRKRLSKFFNSLYACIRRGGRAVFQFYPESPDQLELVTGSAMKAGFSGGLVVDYPNSTRAKKYFLCLYAGPQSDPRYSMPAAVGEEYTGEEEEPTSAAFEKKRERRKRRTERTSVKGKDWVKAKKEKQRAHGKEVRPDSRYTARKRPTRF